MFHCPLNSSRWSGLFRGQFLRLRLSLISLNSGRNALFFNVKTNFNRLAPSTEKRNSSLTEVAAGPELRKFIDIEHDRGAESKLASLYNSQSSRMTNEILTLINE